MIEELPGPFLDTSIFPSEEVFSNWTTSLEQILANKDFPLLDKDLLMLIYKDLLMLIYKDLLMLIYKDLLMLIYKDLLMLIYKDLLMLIYKDLLMLIYKDLLMLIYKTEILTENIYLVYRNCCCCKVAHRYREPLSISQAQCSPKSSLHLP